ncbi:MAG: hypothetical protein ABR500_08835 [Dermatophilaceae bacterium]|nr:hypothetical protein [Intrasporangiaceae bacterium]
MVFVGAAITLFLLVFAIALIIDQKSLPERNRQRALQLEALRCTMRELEARERDIRAREDRERERQRARELGGRVSGTNNRKGERRRKAPITKRSEARDSRIDTEDAASKAGQHLADLNQRLADVAEAYAAGSVTLEQMTLITARLRPEIEQAEMDCRRHPTNDYDPPDQVGTDA